MIKSSLTGFGIIIICLLIPLVHFVTGPLGPFIGGWFAGSRAKPNASHALLLGILMGVFMILPLGLMVVIEIISPTIIPLNISHHHIGAISIGVILYTSTLGTFGALLGSNMSRRTNGSN